MKRLVVISIWVFLLNQALAQSPVFNYVKQVGGPDSDYSSAIAIDQDQNIYLTGFYRQTVDFDPDTGVFNLSSNGLEDVFIQKLDSAGNLIWAKTVQGAGSGSGAGFDLVIDANNDLIMTGIFDGTIDFDPDTGVYNLTSVSSKDNFILKLDSSGAFLWAKSIGGTSSVYGWSVAVDTSDHIYVTGGFKGTVDFDPGPSVFSMVSVTNSEDIYVMKLTGSGNFVWVKQMRGVMNNYGHSIHVDQNDNIYVGGHFRGSVDFDPSPVIQSITAYGNEDAFVQKLDTAGNLIWIKKFGGLSDDQCNGVTTDLTGNVLFTGFFREQADFDPSVNTFNLTCTGYGNGLNYHDAFVCKIDPSGNLIWAKNFGSNNVDLGKSIVTDATNSIYTIGLFRDTMDIDPGLNTDSVLSKGSDDIFVQKLSSSGNFLWGLTYGSGGIEDGTDLAVGADGAVYITGSFVDTVDFNHDTLQVDSLISNGLEDYFMLKLNQMNPVTEVEFHTPLVQSVSIFPNPCEDYVHVLSEKKYSKYTITDVFGRVVKTGSFISSLPVGFLKSGVYLLTLEKSGTSNTMKFIKN